MNSFTGTAGIIMFRFSRAVCLNQSGYIMSFLMALLIWIWVGWIIFSFMAIFNFNSTLNINFWKGQFSN